MFDLLNLTKLKQLRANYPKCKHGDANFTAFSSACMITPCSLDIITDCKDQKKEEQLTTYYSVFLLVFWLQYRERVGMRKSLVIAGFFGLFRNLPEIKFYSILANSYSSRTFPLGSIAS